MIGFFVSAILLNGYLKVISRPVKFTKSGLLL